MPRTERSRSSSLEEPGKGHTQKPDGAVPPDPLWMVNIRTISLRSELPDVRGGATVGARPSALCGRR